MIALDAFPNLYKKAKPAEENPFDIRFEETVSLVEQDKLAEAVPLIEPILQEGCLDIRLIMYLFYAHFLDRGIQSIAHIFPNIISLLDEHWDKITPIQMREKHTLNSLTWFFTSIKKKLQRSEKIVKENKSDPFWDNTVATLTPSEIENLIAITRILIDFFNNKWERPAINQYILFILKWLQDFSPAPSKEESLPEEPEEALPEPEPLPTPPQQDPFETLLLSSTEMRHLYKKMQLFEELIEQNNFTKASLIADDIKTLTETHNLAHFFPKLFAPFFALLAKHIDTLMEYWQAKETPQWQALCQLYQTDLEAFINW